MFPRASGAFEQTAQRDVGQGGGDKVASREDQGVEQGRQSARGCAEVGARSLAATGPESLGNTIGTPEKVNDRIEEERRLWETIPVVLDLQCAWQLLVRSANPRANHSLRTMPPSSTTEYARAHDEGMWQTVETLLQQTPGTEAERAFARDLATLPMRMGGLGLRSATRCAE